MKNRMTIKDRVIEKSKDLGLVYGYIGNFETWGDERHLYIEVPTVMVESTWSNTTAKIWSKKASEATNDDWKMAYALLKAYELGQQAAAIAAAIANS